MDTSRCYEKLASDSQLSDQESALIGFSARFLDPPLANSFRTALDAGAGYGRFTVPLASRGERVVAIELSHSMILRLRHNISKSRLTNVDIIRGDIRFLPLRASSVDAALCWATIYYVPTSSWGSIISQLALCLSDGGELVVQFKTLGRLLRSAKYGFGLVFLLAHSVLIVRRLSRYRILGDIELEGRYEYRPTKKWLLHIMRRHFRILGVQSEKKGLDYVVVRARKLCGLDRRD